MKIYAEHPIWLALIPLILAGLILTYKQLNIRDSARRKSIVIIRGILLLLLTTALVGIHLQLGSDYDTTIFLVDVSDSMTGYSEETENYIKNAVDERKKKDRIGIIAFGKDSKIEQFVTKDVLFSKIQTSPSSSATNIENAFRTALSMFSPEAGKRIVLVTDGMENEGAVKNMSDTLASGNISLKVHKIEKDKNDEVYIKNLKVPELTKIGDNYSIQIEIESNHRTSALLTLYSENKKIVEQSVNLETGMNRYVFQDTQQRGGVRKYRAVIAPESDTLTINNEYTAFTKSEASDRILLIEGKDGISKEFMKVLTSANMEAEAILPQSVPRSIAGLNEYKAIILLDVFKDDLPETFLDMIETYVKDFGGGLAAIGGDNSFALGNYRDSVLEKILPVYMDLKGEKEIPETAYALVIDHSGSMSAGRNGRTQLDLAKQAAVNAAENIRPSDRIGVLSFDDKFSWTVPLASPDNMEDITNSIYGIQIEGGTSIYPALKEAAKKLEQDSAKLKHIILLTDGQDGFHEYQDLLEEMNLQNITLSTVAVGDQSDINILKWLASRGGGRFYYTDINSDLPRIFAQELFLSTKAYLVNRSFQPAAVGGSEIIEPLMDAGMPWMYGYIASTKKELATAHLISDTNDPILTTWQYGLGRTAAFNSDGIMEWTRDYAVLTEYSMFWRNLLDWMIMDDRAEGNETVITQNGTELKIAYTTKNFSENTKITAAYTTDEGLTEEMQLEAKSPGLFEADISFDKMGIYSINIRQEENGELLAMENKTAAVQYSKEYQIAEDSGELDELVRTAGGSYIAEPKQVFEGDLKGNPSYYSLTNILLLLSALLFFYDILNRRFRLKFSKHRERAEEYEKREDQSQRNRQEHPVSNLRKKKLSKKGKRYTEMYEQEMDNSMNEEKSYRSTEQKSENLRNIHDSLYGNDNEQSERSGKIISQHKKGNPSSIKSDSEKRLNTEELLNRKKDRNQ